MERHLVSKYVENKRTKQQMPHFFQFYLDFKKNEDRFNIKTAVENLKIPFLVVHGDKDSSVLPLEGRRLYTLGAKTVRFLVYQTEIILFLQNIHGKRKSFQKN